jgi:hypothetical protein
MAAIPLRRLNPMLSSPEGRRNRSAECANPVSALAFFRHEVDGSLTVVRHHRVARQCDILTKHPAPA